MIQVFENLSALPAPAKNPVLAIGNFDGVHLGHQALLAETAAMARAKKTSPAVMTFEPHPREFFQPEALPFRLTLLPMKQRLMAESGIACLFSAPFNAALANLPADEFMQLLRDKIEPAHIVVGADFSFGKGRSGNVDSLRRNFDVSIMTPVCCADGTPYSSTRIRAHIAQGEMGAAAKLLGRAWEIEAEVVHGNKNGRALGFPTANQNLPRYARMLFGVYAVEAFVNDRWQPGVANFGIRPMFKTEEPLFETHIFDFNKDIYGNKLRVRPLKYLRPEMVFDGLPALQAQMKQDCVAARQWLGSDRNR